MKIVLENEKFGKVIWEVPSDLATLIEPPEKALTTALDELAFGREFANQIAGNAKGAVIGIIQKQIDSFFLLLVTAHRGAKTANPPSKFSKIVEQGLVWTTTKMKKAATKK